jgi:hypothetical protein
MERRHRVFDNGTLTISKIVRKDAGSYACSATNRQGSSATQSGELKVIGECLAMIHFAAMLPHAALIIIINERPAAITPVVDLEHGFPGRTVSPCREISCHNNII